MQVKPELERQLEDQLLAARARLTAESDARQQIERDLHDGAQQRLLAALMRVERAKAAAADRPELIEQLDAVRAELERLYDELLDVAEGAYPALLRDFGIEQALRAAAERAAAPTTVVTDIRRRYGSVVEQTVYCCCIEALENVARHAGPGASASVSVREADGRVVFEVVDDGVGFDGGRESGSGRGLDDMRDRLVALGGALEIESRAAGGTTVRGILPLTTE